MNSFTLLLVCIQALLIQNVLSCPCSAPAPYSCGSPAPTYSSRSTPAPAYSSYGASAPAYSSCGASTPAYSSCGASAPGYSSCGASAPAYGSCGAPAPYPANIAPAPYGIRVQGNSLVIDGTAKVWGDVPLASSVALDGEVDAEGTASLRNACCCGDSYLR